MLTASNSHVILLLAWPPLQQNVAVIFCANICGDKIRKSAGEKLFKQEERGYKLFGHISDRFSDLFFPFFKPRFVSKSKMFRGRLRSAHVLSQPFGVLLRTQGRDLRRGRFSNTITYKNSNLFQNNFGSVIPPPKLPNKIPKAIR